MKRKLLFFDTETTGLPADFNADSREFQSWPELVQLGWMLTDETGKRLKWYNEMIKPRVETLDLQAIKGLRGYITMRYSPGWHIPPNMIHGISHKRATEIGHPVNDVLEAFRQACYIADVAVCHNVDFDLPVIRAAYYREGQSPPVGHLPFYCTQKQSTETVKAPAKANNRRYGPYKWPSLAELHGFCGFGVIEDAHDALADVEATSRCFFYMQEKHPAVFRHFYLEGQRMCIRCNCTDDNCEECVLEQGFPCHWINERLCSRCAPHFHPQIFFL